MIKYKNTLENGSTRVIVFKEHDDWYAVALELNIVESGKTSQEATSLLFEALSGYIEVVRKTKADLSVLNQETDKEYEDMWQRLQERKKLKSKQISFFGEYSLCGSFMPA
ncbi:MAG: hypothetical protein PHV25_01390 [Candidatus Pacebacteria bacterium]|nr:hypothetical protein [Candidatus Paceibacterota bacterium]